MLPAHLYLPEAIGATQNLAYAQVCHNSVAHLQLGAGSSRLRRRCFRCSLRLGCPLPGCPQRLGELHAACVMLLPGTAAFRCMMSDWKSCCCNGLSC